MEKRQQRYLAAVVNYGLALHADAGAYQAALYMAERGVPIQVARRVLTRPHQRRS